MAPAVMKLLFVSIFLIGIVSAQDDLDSLIKNIFNDSAGTPNTDGTLVINPVPTPVPTPTPTPTRQTQTSVTTNPPELVTPSTDHSYQPCGVDKECVRQYLCSDGRVNSDGATLIDVRIADTCPFLETCCAISDKVDTPIISHVEEPTGCGYRNVDGVGYKIEGDSNEAQFGEFPWMAAILRKENTLNQTLLVYQCGGSLLTPQVILTGAHCVQARAPNSFIVRMGEWETNTKTELLPDQDRDVVEMAVHPNYNKGSLYNDIALLFVDMPFDLAPNVNTICLPPLNFNFDMSRCYATGWGKDKFQNGRYQNILKKIDLPVVPNAQCQTNLRKTRLGKYFELHRSFMCAGGEAGKDTCHGDGGSPLVCPIPGSQERFYQAGIVAWGIGCGEVNVPGVYASVVQGRAWIDEQLAYKHVDTKFFTA